MLDIEHLTLKQLREINNIFPNLNNDAVKLKFNEKENAHPYILGKYYFIRTVTMYLVGELRMITEKELVLKNASWVADMGRFHDALKIGELNEVEPFINDVILNRGSIIDATEWTHKLPTEQK